MYPPDAKLDREPRDSYPRLAKRKVAAQRYGLSPSTFDRLVKQGIIPPKLRGTNLWDLRAIDASLDKVSGLHAANDNYAPGSDQAEMALQAWLKSQEAA